MKRKSEKPLIEWNVVTWYSKLLAIILFVASVCGAFCLGIWYQQQTAPFVESTVKSSPVTEVASVQDTSVNERQPEPQEEKKTISLTKIGNKMQAVDSVTGISFSYPAEWGLVEIEDEHGTCPATLEDPCNFRIYLFPSINDGSVFLAAETSGHMQYPVGRDGFWGDTAGAVSRSFASACKADRECKLITNSKGTVLAKRGGFYDMGDSEDAAKNATGYSTYSDKGPYYGIVLSAKRMSEPGDAYEKQFEEIVVASLKLSAHP